MGCMRSASGRKRKSGRGERDARFGRYGRRPRRGARHGKRRGERLAGTAARRRYGAAGGRRICGNHRPHLSDLAQVSRRQRRGDGMRRLLGADSSCAATRTGDLRRRRLADQVHLSRIGAGVARAAAARVRARQPGARRGCGARVGHHHRIPAPIERRAPADRHRAPDRSARVVRTVAVLGAGSWGTALAVHLGRVGHDVRLWARDAALVHEMAVRRVNAVYLPDVGLPETVSLTDSIASAVRDTELVVSAIPSHGCRAVIRDAAPHLARGAVIVSATKGLEARTMQRMSEVVAQEAGTRHPVVVLSGPSFAIEVARQLPTAVLVASCDASAIELVQREFRGPSFRLYASDDVIGVEIGGALKNIIAIAAGVVEGLGLGHNALAALITRGLAELTRLACAAGGRRETLAGLSGLGDLVLTCTGS